jgi:squalene synthase HpnC
LSSDNSAVNAPFLSSAQPVGHYENFPVASWLCPPALRVAVAAIYWFARTADDLADEGDAPPAQRLQALADYRADLQACVNGGSTSARWPQVFGPLAQVVRKHALPAAPLSDLLAAFEQDVLMTRDCAGYANRAELLDYCARSANPVGRLLLHLYGVNGQQALAQSDNICTALQLTNFWQDLSLDMARGRYYLPGCDCRQLGMDPGYPATWPDHANAAKLVECEVQWTRDLMQKGAALVHRIPGRAGWELRLAVQGGLRILDKIEAGNFDSFSLRPRLGPWDAPRIFWRSIWM